MRPTAPPRPPSKPEPLIEDLRWGPPLTSLRMEFRPAERRVRAFLGATAVVDSTDAMLMLEASRLPVYYLPLEDVRTDLFLPGSRTTGSTHKGEGVYWSVGVGGRVVADAAWRYPHPPPGCPDISRYVAFHWQKLDAWFEEDEEVRGHPHDPYHRIDILESSRHVRVEVGRRVVADTRLPRLLLETGLPTRFYIPRLDVRLDLLRPSDLQTTCAYKGTTSAYWTAADQDDRQREVAWCYATPTLECAKIANLVSFFNERVDITVDGVRLPRPKTPWRE